MAGWNGSGDFTLPYDWEADAAAGIDILASRMDTQFATISTDGFGNTLTRDGQGIATANLPMDGFKHTGAAVASGNGEYVVYQQITGGSIPGSFTNLTASGTLSVAGAASLHATTITGVATVTNGTTIVAGGLKIIAGGADIEDGLLVHDIMGVLGILTASGGLAVTGGAAISGGLTVATGALVVTAGTVSASGGGTFGGNSAITGVLTVSQPGTAGTQAVNFGQFVETHADPLSAKGPGGLVVKAGTSTSGGSGLVTVTFGTAFPAACVSVTATLTGATPVANGWTVGVVSQGTADIHFVTGQAGIGTSGMTFNWVAVGY